MASAPELSSSPPDAAALPDNRRKLLIGRLSGSAALIAAALVTYLSITHWDSWVGSARHQRTDDA